MLIELMVAIGILATALLPLALSFEHEQRLLRSQYYRAVAMEIVDGEMELLAAGEWRAFPTGTSEYPVRSEAARNLPAGRFVLTVDQNRVRLEWSTSTSGMVAPVVREVSVR